jgi:hypothetical protein
MRSIVLASLALLPFATGCLNEHGEYDLGPYGGEASGGDGGPPVLTTTDATGAGCTAPRHCPIAVGGSTFVTVANGTAAGIEVKQASPAFELVDAPSRAGTTGYVLTATAQAQTTLMLTSVNYPEDAEEIAAFAVEDVRLEPTQAATHRPLGTELAWHTSTRVAVIAVHGADSRRLVDVSLDLKFASSEVIKLVAWDTLSLPTIPGHYTVLVGADSFSQRQLAFDLAAGIDRIETSVDGTLARVGDTAEICFYPLFGALDVAVPLAIELGGTGALTQVGTTTATNCRRVVAKAAGIQQVDGTALGIRTSLTFDVAP